MTELHISDEANKLVEIVLQKAIIYEQFYITGILKDELLQYDGAVKSHLALRVDEMLKHFKYITPGNFDTYVLLTSNGILAKRIGGHSNYLDYLEKKENALQAKEIAEYENLIHATKVNKYLYKTRWVPHILATAALGVSVWALVESKKENVPDIKTKPEVKASTVKDSITKTKNVINDKK